MIMRYHVATSSRLMRGVIAFFERFLVGVRRCKIGTVRVHAAAIYSAVKERGWREVTEEFVTAGVEPSVRPV
jgi:hypothetical protein